MDDLDQISGQVEADRARLAQSLDALTETVNPQKLAQDATAAVNDLGGNLARNAWGALRDNPAGGLLVTIGLGLMASGTSPRPVPEPRTTAADPDEAFDGFDTRVAQADAEMRAEMTGQYEPEHETSRLQAAIDHGLDQLPPQARDRVVAAREAAINAQDKIERQTRRAAQKTKGFVQEQPLAAGAIALGFGVLAGTLLRGTRREDALLGARRDALMQDARDVLEAELAKAKSQAERVISEKADALASTPHR